jgi:arginine/lysine/ornithine decarboxylase
VAQRYHTKDHVALTYDLLESTSPCVPIFASIDATRRTYALHGERLVRTLIRRARHVRAKLSAIEGIRVMGDEVLNGAGAFGWDPTKVLIDVSGLGLSGYEADDWLEAERKLTVGLSDERKVLAIFGVGTGFKDAHALVSGTTARAHAARHGEIAAKGHQLSSPTPLAASLRRWCRPTRPVSLGCYPVSGSRRRTSDISRLREMPGLMHLIPPT